MHNFVPPLTLYEGTFVDTPVFGLLRLRHGRTLAVDSLGNVVADIEIGVCIGVDDSLLRDGVSDARAQGRVVTLEHGQFFLPGFVDCHVHAPQYSYCGTGLDLPLMGPEGWLEQYTFPAERRVGEDLRAAEAVYRGVVARTLRCGTTAAMYFATLHLEPTKVLADVADELGQRALIGKVAMDRNSPHSYCASASENVADTEAFIDYIRDYCSDRIAPVITPRFVPTCSPDLLRSLGDLAARRGCHVQTHVAESLDEVAFCRELEPACARDAELLDRCGLVVGPGRTVLAHGVHLSDAELDMLGSRGAAVAHCPLSNAYFADGVFRVRQALDRGVRVGLGTDVAGGYDPSMLSSIRAAAWSSRFLEKGASGFDFGNGAPAAPVGAEVGARISHCEALWLATMGGAAALGLEGRIGSFEVGKAFDAVLVDLRAADSPVDIFPQDKDVDLVEKFLLLGDDRNVVSVFVQGRCVSARSPEPRRRVMGARL